jgi:transposase
METLTLTTQQRRRLEQQLRNTRDARVFRRTLSILEIAQGVPVTSVAHRLRVTPRVVYYWIETYTRCHDTDDLLDQKRSGRPTRLTREDRNRLLEFLHCSPQDLGYFATEWTVGLLREHLERYTGKRLSKDTVRRELHQLNYVWKRPRYVLDPDPELREKKRRIRRHIREFPSRSVLLAEDETDLLLFPPLRAAWSPQGQVKQVMLSGKNARRTIFGAMNLRTGRRLFLCREHQRAADFQAFLRVVHYYYRSWHVTLLLDEDPSHTAKGSVQLAGWLDMDLLWLPKRSPKLNPMDTLWGQGKDVISADKQYATIDEQVNRFLRYLESLSAREALHTAGMYSQRFWLTSVL